MFVYVTQKTLFSNICSSKKSTFLFIGLQKRLNIFFFFLFFFQSFERLLCVDSFISSENCSFSSLIKKYFKARMVVRKSPHRFGSKISVIQKFSDNSLRECHLHCIRWMNSSKYFLSSASFK